LLTELKKLIDLQELDNVIQGVTQALEKLPEDLQAGEAALAELQADNQAHLQELENLKKLRRETELEAKEMEDGIKKSRQRLMEIKSNIEYKAMLKEIAFKEDQRDQKETRILELMELMETENRVLASQDQEIKEQQTQLGHQRVEVEAQVGKLRQELAVLDEQRRKLKKTAPAQLVKRYEFIRSRRNSTAVAPVREGVCLGCNMNILPQQFIDLQKGVEILQCPHCQRILYWQEEVQEEESAGPDLS
jgi:uncharacterized protein